MLLLIHLIVAFGSIAAATYAYVHPTSAKLRVSYLLATATLGSGTALIISSPAHLVQGCVVGATYLVVVAFVIVKARGRLARSTQ